MRAFDIKKKIGELIPEFCNSGEVSNAFDIECGGEYVCLSFHRQNVGISINATTPENELHFLYRSSHCEKFNMQLLDVL